MTIKGEFTMLGSTGFIGRSVFENLSRQYLIRRVGRNDLDLTYVDSVRDWILSVNSDTIVNFAGFTDVAGSEKEKDGDVEKLNTILPGVLAAETKRAGKRFIHISTDFVFPGISDYPGPYKETEALIKYFDYMGRYAKSKFVGEMHVMQENPDAAIVRISYPFGYMDREKDYALKMLDRTLMGGKPFKDQYISPTYLPDLGLALNRIIELKKSGIFHVATNPSTTPVEFISYLFKKLGIANPLITSSVKEYNKKQESIPIPTIGGLDTTKTERELGLKFTDWRVALDQYCERLFVSSTSISKLI